MIRVCPATAALSASQRCYRPHIQHSPRHGLEGKVAEPASQCLCRKNPDMSSAWRLRSWLVCRTVVANIDQTTPEHLHAICDAARGAGFILVGAKSRAASLWVAATHGWSHTCTPNCLIWQNQPLPAPGRQAGAAFDSPLRRSLISCESYIPSCRVRPPRTHEQLAGVRV